MKIWQKSIQIVILLSVLAFHHRARAEAPVHSLRVPLAGQKDNVIKTSWPAIGCWFWSDAEFQPEGYKRFIDLHAAHSHFGLLTTSIRHNVEVTQPDVHDQIKRAAHYAREHGMHIVMDLDVRLARQAFMDRYPDEMQELVRIRELALPTEHQASLVIEAFATSDHYTPGQWGVRPYESLSGRLLRAYSYVAGPQGIVPGTLEDITVRCQLDSNPDHSVKVTIPCTTKDKGRTACVLVSFKLFSPDVFAPHLPEFERAILEQYADVPLAGACKDEWGFPGRFAPRADDYYFSNAMAQAYAQRRPGKDLVRDMLLMYKPQTGLEDERAAAVNHYMEMIWQRNAEVENSFYRAIKDVFGPEAMSATHPTWYPDPATREEVFKNGLDWWACKRDLAQTDESTPFSVRTALAKKWHSPLWFNMFYERSLEPYHVELWSHVLGGGRMNFHPIYPAPKEAAADHRTVSLLKDNLLAADFRISLLNYIAAAPIDCPVAVVFGHPAALNWTEAGLADVGLEVADRLWAEGFYADLLPSSEIGAGHLKIGADGCIQYGPQRYRAVVLYHPQFERPAVAEFFRKAAAQGNTALFRVGDWTKDFAGNPFNGANLPSAMKLVEADSAADAVVRHLKSSGISPQTVCHKREFIHSKAVMPGTSGQCRLLDGTVILASGEQDIMGDPIRQTIRIQGHDVYFDAIGLAAVRLDPSGKVQALAAGGLKTFQCGKLRIDLTDPVDLALWRNTKGRWCGVVHGGEDRLPEALTRLTNSWTRVNAPVPLPKAGKTGLIRTAPANGEPIQTWRVMEFALNSIKSYPDPFTQVEVSARFTGPGGTTITRPAFWDGGQTWKIRFAPTRPGAWNMVTLCSDTTNAELHHLSSSFACTEYAGNVEIYKHGFIKISPNKRYFVYDDGTPFFWMSEDHAAMHKEHWGDCNKPGCTSQFRYMADKRKEQGFTIYQSVIWTKSAWAADGLPDLDVYLDYDRKFQYLADLGFVNAFALGYHTELGDCEENPDAVATMQRAAKYVEARYGAYPVVYETAGEFNIPCKESKGKLWDRSWWGKVAETIHAHNAYRHPQSIGYWQPQGTWFADQPYLQWWALQAYSRRETAYYAYWWRYNPPKPLVDTWSGMDHGDEKTRSTERHIQYLIMQSGGAGNGILTEGIWNACWQQDSCSCCEKIWGGTPWHTTIDFASADDMTRLKTFYTSLPWWNLTPRFDDPLWSDFKDRKTSALSSDANRTYVAYFWNADTSTGILKNLQVDKTYSARWYDPVKGSYLPIGTFVAGTDGLWSIPFKPDRKDWLLLVARE